MTRQARLLEDGGFYHVLTRGNDRKKIFRYSQDFLRFIQLVVETLEKHPVQIYHYCLMGNHIHFLIKAVKAHEVSKFFHVLLQRYAYCFRKRYQHTGYVFQNRYKSCPIEKESYLLECARYIERNPVRAKLVCQPEEYRWSSYLCYAEGRRDDIIKEMNPMYIELAETEAERRILYRGYILQERPYESIVDKGLRI